MLCIFVAAGARLRRAVRLWCDFVRDRSAGTTMLTAMAMPVLKAADQGATVLQPKTVALMLVE